MKKSFGRLIMAAALVAQPAGLPWSAPTAGSAAQTVAPAPWESVLAKIGVNKGKTMPADAYELLVHKLSAFPPIAAKIRQASTKPITVSEWAQIMKGLGIAPKPVMKDSDWVVILAGAGVEVTKGISPSLAGVQAPVPAAASAPAAPVSAPAAQPASAAAPVVVLSTSPTAAQKTPASLAPVVALSSAPPSPATAQAAAPSPAASPDQLPPAAPVPEPAAPSVQVATGTPVHAPAAAVVRSSTGAVHAADSSAAPAQTLSLELRGMDINEVLKTIGRQGSLNIVTGANVRGSVSISLKNVDLWEALRQILEANDLAYAYDGSVVRVMTAGDYEKLYGARFDDKTVIETLSLANVKASAMGKYLDSVKSKVGKILVYDYNNTLILVDTPDSIKRMKQLAKQLDGKMRLKIYPLNYAKAEDLLPKIQPLVTKDIGDIEIDKRTNRMIVMDFEDHFGPIDLVIAAFDRKHRSVLIEAKILQISLNKSHQLGVNWQYIFSQLGDHKIPGSVQGNFTFLPIPAPEGSQVLTASLGTLADNNYTALLQALETVGKTNLLSSPRITAINNEMANILVGTREAYVTSTITTPGGGAPVTTAEQINFVDVGVKLHVTPTIGEDDYITLKIKPEVSSVDRTIKTSQGNVIPIVRTSQAETSVLVKDGETILLAGLIEDNNTNTKTGIPWLARIPILGIPFRSHTKTVGKTDITVMLTPHILQDDGRDEAADAASLAAGKEIR